MEDCSVSEKRLARVNDQRMLFGVAAGVANYLNIDPTIVRALFVIGTILGGPGILAYFILLLVMPEDGFTGSVETFDPDEIVIKDP